MHRIFPLSLGGIFFPVSHKTEKTDLPETEVYFEKRFGINILGAFTVNTDVMPGAEQLAEIREVIEHDKVSCIFSEPQFNPDIIKAVAKDTNVATGVIDPLGATLNPGKDLYFDLIRNMYASFKSC